MTRLPQLTAAALFAVAAPLAAQGGYGTAVAVSNGVVFVAEPGSVTRAGTVYLYRPGADGRLTEVAKLTGPNGQPRDGFGVALAAAGGRLLVARPGEGDSRGAVHVFERRGQTDEWRPAGRLVAADLAAGDSFGVSVALDGDVAAVGAVSTARPGAVYVFRRGSNGQWAQEATLVAGDGQPGDGFGMAVSVAEGKVLVGAPMQAKARGGAYLFRRDAGAAWQEEARLVARTVTEGDRLGSVVMLHGGKAYASSPRRDGNAGAVYIFENNPDFGGWAAFTRLFPYEGSSQTRFGSSMAFVGEELWVGAPGSDGFIGAIYRLRWDAAKEDWVAASKLVHPEAQDGDAMAAAFAADDALAVAALPGDDFQAGTAVGFARAGSEWRPLGKVFSAAESFAAVTGRQVDCSDGNASAFACSNVDLLGFLPVSAIGGSRGIRLNDIWGWTDPQSGREYALVGRMDGTSFVDISDPVNPRYLGQLPMTQGARANSWRDIKVYRDHAYIVADGAGPHGMQVFDLARLRDVRGEPVTFAADYTYDRIQSAHNIVINEEAGFAFPVGASGGTETCGGGLHMVDIREPKTPKFVGCFADAQTGRASTGYSHDAQCVTYRGPDQQYAGREICFGANETALSIADVTDKTNPVALSRASYPNVGYSHQGWLTDDQRYFYMDDELDELSGTVSFTRTIIWDVSDLDDPQVAAEFMGTTQASDHNLYIKGDTMYQSNYQAGLRVVDISDRENPREIGFFDTVPYGTNTPGFGGSWSNYPFFRSGAIVVTSGNEGLFIVRPRKPVS